jgi:hypothetical protein
MQSYVYSCTGTELLVVYEDGGIGIFWTGVNNEPLLVSYDRIDVEFP